MTPSYQQFSFEQGLTLLVEPIANVRSVSFNLLLPAGLTREPEAMSGAAHLLTELVSRGGGNLDNRALTVALDNLGVQRSESAEIYHAAFGGATLAENLAPALELIFTTLRTPHLYEEQLQFCKAGTLQEIQAIEDEPGQKLFIELRRCALPPPLGRPVLGTLESVQGLTRDQLLAFHRQGYHPNQAILGIAGAVEPQAVRALVARLLTDWEPQPLAPVVVGEITPSQTHLFSKKEQTHIGLTFPSVAYDDPDFFNAYGAAGVLGGSMSARLFTEVREKRGLCYSVSASYAPLLDRGLFLCYASTTNERAKQTLEVLLAELEKLRLGIELAEVERVRAGLKSSLIMQQESTAARASVLAHSYYFLGRVRTLPEVAAAIDQITPTTILDYLERHPFGSYTLLTLGPEPLEGVPS